MIVAAGAAPQARQTHASVCAKGTRKVELPAVSTVSAERSSNSGAVAARRRAAAGAAVINNIRQSLLASNDCVFL